MNNLRQGIPLPLIRYSMRGMLSSCFVAGQEWVGIDRTTVPIKKYRWRSKPISNADWLKLEKRMYTLRFSVFGGNTLIISVKQETRLDETWTIPYNPVERE